MKYIYIAGKISDLNYNDVKSKFKNSYDLIKTDDNIVITPIDIITFNGNYSKSWIKNKILWYKSMYKCVKILLHCDEIYFLPDWKYSKGARIEYKISRLFNKNISFI